MKKSIIIIFLAILTLSLNSGFAQITMHKIPKTEFYKSGTGIDVIKLTSGDKIITYDTNTIKLYNQDFSIYKTFNIPKFSGYELDEIEYSLSTDKLWNLDDKVEFCIVYLKRFVGNKMLIVNEDGIDVFNIEINWSNASLGDIINVDNKWYYKYNSDSAYYAYELPGSMPTSTKDKEIKILPSESNISVYPNPVNNEFTVFSPNTHIANIKIVSTDGKQIKSVNVNDRNEKKINISAADMQSGTYIMQLTTESGEKFIKKIVKQ